MKCLIKNLFKFWHIILQTMYLLIINNKSREDWYLIWYYNHNILLSYYNIHSSFILSIDNHPFFQEQPEMDIEDDISLQSVSPQLSSVSQRRVRTFLMLPSDIYFFDKTNFSRSEEIIHNLYKK